MQPPLVDLPLDPGWPRAALAALSRRAGRVAPLLVPLAALAAVAVLMVAGSGHGAITATAVLGMLALVMVLRQTAALDAARRRRTQALEQEYARLEAEVQRRTEDLTELAKHLQAVREDERSRLARELHDELGALLTAAKLDVARLRRSLGPAAPETLARLEHLNASLDSGIALKRHIIEDLRPSALDNLGLACALDIQLREFAERTGVQVHSELQAAPLPDSQQITVYRLVQEALTNIAKYAAARSVDVDLRVAGASARVSVRDDGCGFDPRTQRRSAHGLMGMRYRVEAAGGRLSIRSAPGRGTQIEAELPLHGAPRRATDGAAAGARA